MFDTSRQTDLDAKIAVAPPEPVITPALKKAIRLQYYILGAVVLKFGALLVGAMASRGWLG